MDGMIYIVDDDEALRDALGLFLRTQGLSSQSFASGEEFLDKFVELGQTRGVVLLDVRMPGLSGVQVFDEMLNVFEQPPLPVIFLTGHADVPMAVECLKKGAFDFFEKPFDNKKMLERLNAALAESAVLIEKYKGNRSLQDNMASLTEREQEVMKLIVAGRLNKVIADELKISMRTVEVHRSRIFSKMGVRSAVELANLLKTA